MITILGSIKQYQCEILYTKLCERGFDVCVVDFLKNSSITAISNKDGFEYFCDGKKLNQTKIVYHDPKYMVEHFGDTEEWIEKYSISYGWKYANLSLFELLPGKKLNSVATILPFHAKLKQLQQAAEIGFDIPPFLLSNDKNSLLEFASDYPSVVTKDIGNNQHPSLFEGRVTGHSFLTAPVSLELLSNISEREPYPALLQENIDKKFEYRVIVAGKRMCAFRIDPNQHPIMKQDYRRGGMMVQYIHTRLPAERESMLLKLHEKLGLFSGSYDFIEATDGRFVFLEVNPAGVWAYIDTVSNGIVSDMFASEIESIYKDLNSN